MSWTRICAPAALAVAISGAGAAAATLSTGFAGGNGAAGNMFDVTIGANPITVTGLELHLSTADGPTPDVFFYFREGTFQGFETDPAAWTLQDTATLTAAGSNAATPWDVADLTLEANTTYGFYLGASSFSMDYTDGTSVGAVAASNADLTIFEGVGRGNPAFEEGIFTPRVWNGTIEYTLGTGEDTAVPLPAGLPLMLGALATLGMLKRRRAGA